MDTLNQIDSELDDLLAEKIMGWHLSSDGHWLNEDEEEDSGFRKLGSRYCPECSTWEPSGYISSVWHVVEKLGLWVFSYKGIWYAGLVRDNHWSPYIDTELGVMDFSFNALESAETAPLAICKAAKVLIQ